MVMAGIDPTWITGTYGGIMGMAFGAGAMGGYGFAARTILKAAQERIAEFKLSLREQKVDFDKRLVDEHDQRLREREECKRDIESLKGELKQMREMLLGRRPVGYFDGMRLPPDTPQDMTDQVRELDKRDGG